MAESKPKVKYRKNPPFPYIGISKAVDLIKILYAEARFYEVSAKLALEYMGYKWRSSSSDRVLSALLKYELLLDKGTGDEKQVWLSDIAKSILLSVDSEKKKSAITKAVLNDEQIQRAKKRWPSGLPSSDQAIISTLMLDMDFVTERGASTFVSVLRDAYEAADLGKVITIEAETLDSQEVESEHDENDVTPEDHPTMGYDSFTLTLGDGKEIKVFVSGDWTEDDLEFAITWLKRLGITKPKTTMIG